MAAKKQIEIKSFSADELLAELRNREAGGDDKALARTTTSAKQLDLVQMKSADLVEALRDSQKLIYGMDDRMEVFQINDSVVRERSRSVASLIDVADIESNGDGTSTIRTVNFGVAQQLCSSETFREQPTSPFCTGFLVGEQLLATAGHCVDGNTLARTRYVFGFEMKPNGQAHVRIPDDDIYSGVSIVARKLENAGADYALVKLDRPVTGRAILPVRRTGKVLNNRAIYVIGHPSGLPAKYAPNAIVRDNSPDEFFVANLDTYGGNSGSPVFDQETNLVEGILVRGETDFVLSGTCRVSNVCPTTGCRGEDVTRTTQFAQFIPETANPPQAPQELDERVGSLEVAVKSIHSALERIEKKLP